MMVGQNGLLAAVGAIIWERLHIGACLKAALKDRAFTAPVEQALFAMVANRALSPSSKLAIEQWAAEEVFLGDEAPLQVQHCYRGMPVMTLKIVKR